LLEDYFTAAQKIGINSQEFKKSVTAFVQFHLLTFISNKIRAESGQLWNDNVRVNHIITYCENHDIIGPNHAQLINFNETERILMNPTVDRRKIGVKTNKYCALPMGCAFDTEESATKAQIEIEKDHILPLSSLLNDKQGHNISPLCKRHNHLKGNTLFWDTRHGILPMEWM
jgi:hypothetical protein